MERPYVWQMIQTAINDLNGQASYSQIKDYITNKWGAINPGTVVDQIQVLTVNHNSRIRYPENNKPRLTISNSPYDFLFTTGRGQVVKYYPEVHGIWEIYKGEDGSLAVKKFVAPPSEKVFTPTDILWFKNVTNVENGQAYLDLLENEFVLHFPTKHKANALSPEIDELILIYQKVNGIPAFTHLVTPTDNILVEESTRPKFRYGRNVRIIAKTDSQSFIPVSLTLWNRLNFGGFTQGNACKIDNIANIGNGDELRFDIWQYFIKFFVPTEGHSATTTTALIDELRISNPEITVIEGELRLVAHLVKERNRKIVNEKKQQAIRNNSLKCEVCDFSFAKIFQTNFIECHHLTPIGQLGVRETKLEDLALVCANCHRMLHAKFDNKYLTPEQLKEKIKSLQLTHKDR